MIHIGQYAKDSLTGFRGCVTGKAEYITGCTQFFIQPMENDLAGKDGKNTSHYHKYPEGAWFDDSRLVLIHGETLDLTMDKEKESETPVLPNGGPRHGDEAPSK